jgi:regulator of RNase E activity RraA
MVRLLQGWENPPGIAASPRHRQAPKKSTGDNAMTHPFTTADLDVLAQWDTPTICNGLEVLVPERRALGFTVRQMVAADRSLKPIVGLARTGLIRAREKPLRAIPPREAWYDYVAAGDLPTIAVLQDIDDAPGFGAFWGEVQSTVHLHLGVRGCVTNGSFRDLDMLAPGFQIIGGSVVPSHAHVHMVDMGGEVDVLGMKAAHDDVIHADFHGAVVIPADCVTRLPAAIDLVSRREKVILDLARAPGFDAAVMRQALRKAGEIH